MIALDSLSRERLVFFILFVALVFFPVIRDPDFFFHVTAGAYIVEHHLLPHHDVFSYTMAGAPWVMHEWLFEVLVYELYRLGGDLGVKLLFAALIILTLKLALAACRVKSVNLVILLALLSLVLLAPYLAPRPQVFSFFFYAFSLFALLRWRINRETRWLKWLPLQMVVWANLHGAYLIGIVTIVLFIALAALSPIQDKEPLYQRTRPLLITLLLCVVASAINPYFVQLWLFPLHLMGMPYIHQISEWLPPDFADPIVKLYAAYVGIYLIVAMLYLHRHRSDLTGLIPLPFILASLSSNRHIPFAVLSMTPLLAWQAKGLWQAVAATSPAWLERLRGRLSRGKPLGRMEFQLNWALAILFTVTAAILYPYYHRIDTPIRNQVLPVKATDFLQRTGIEGRMLNTYRYGGYLLYRLYPAQRVFIDIRADMYGPKLMGDYETLFFARPGWQRLMEDYGIDYVIFNRFTPLAQALEKSPWFALVYRDANTIIALRRRPRFMPLIEHYGL